VQDNKLFKLVDNLQKALENIGGELLILSGAVVVITIIWGGIQYIHNPETGKKTLMGALIGLLIVVFSYWLFAVLLSAY